MHFSENNSNKSDINESVKGLAENCLKYLDSRTQFWQQQKPMYARKHEQKKKENARKRATTSAQREPTEWILKNLEEIDAGNTISAYVTKYTRYSYTVLLVTDKEILLNE